MNNETILPVIHSNGNSAQRLFDGYYEAFNKVRDAFIALHNIEFHQRDYYIVDGLWVQANKQHQERLLALEKIRDELETIAIHCNEKIK